MMEQDGLNSPEDVVSELYALISFEVGTTPDWNEVRALFIDEAVIVALAGPVRERTIVYSLDSFIDDFASFVESANLQQTGFDEAIIRMKPTFSGDMAHILVLYETHIPGSSTPPHRGIDSLQLVRHQGRWQIVSITNVLPAPGAPLPEVLRP